MGAQLLVQAALAVQKTRGASSPRPWVVSHMLKALSGHMPVDQLLEKLKEITCVGPNLGLGYGDDTGRSNHWYVEKPGEVPTEGLPQKPSGGADACGTYRCETDAVLELLDALPRGLFRAESSHAPPEAVVAESWKLLREGLARRGGEAKEGVRRADPECAEDIISVEGFPILMSYSVYSLIVAGLAANLLDVEVGFGKYPST